MAPPLLEDPAVTRRVDELCASGGALHGLLSVRATRGVARLASTGRVGRGISRGLDGPPEFPTLMVPMLTFLLLRVAAFAACVSLLQSPPTTPVGPPNPMPMPKGVATDAEQIADLRDAIKQATAALAKLQARASTRRTASTRRPRRSSRH